MKSMVVSNLQQVDGGSLSGLAVEDRDWTFTFQNRLSIQSHSGWRLFDKMAEKRTVLGSRDLEGLDQPFPRLRKELEGFALTVLHFDSMRDRLELVLHDKELNQKSIELQMSSGQYENWRIIGEDFVDTDKINVIEKLE